MHSVYQEFTDRIAADAALATADSAEARQFDWLSGAWNWGGVAVSFAPAPYGVQTDDNHPFLILQPLSGFWVLALNDPRAFGILISPSARGDRIAFTGEVTIDGTAVRLRQSWRRLGADTVEVGYERFEEGRWHPWEQVTLERVRPGD